MRKQPEEMTDEMFEASLQRILGTDAPKFDIRDIANKGEELSAKYQFGIILFRHTVRGWKLKFCLLAAAPPDDKMEALKSRVLNPFRVNGWLVMCIAGDVVGFLVAINETIDALKVSQQREAEGAPLFEEVVSGATVRNVP